MTNRSKAVLETLIRVKSFSTNLPVNPRATALFTQVTDLINVLETAGTDQLTGGASANHGTEDKRDLAKALRAMVREIHRTANGLDEETHPNVASDFPVPPAKSYQVLLATARTYLANVAPIKADLIGSGLAGDFDETLSEQIASFASAMEKHDTGLTKQLRGTRGLDLNQRKAPRLLKKLDATVSNLLKSNAEMLATWKRVVRIRRTPQPDQEEANANGTGSTTAAPATVASSGTGS